MSGSDVVHVNFLGEKITGQQIWKHASCIAEVRNEPADRIALLELNAEQPVVLTGTAAAVWLLIDGHRSQESIVAELSAMYDDADGQMVPHLTSFFAGLSEQRLIEPAAAGA